MRPTTFFPAALALLVGCQDPAGLPKLVLGPGLTEVYASQWSGLQAPLHRVIRDEASWTALWDSIQSMTQPPLPRPQIDFTTQELLVAALGNRPNTGYLVHIDRLVDFGGTGTVFVTTYKAGPSCGTGQAITRSVHVVATAVTASALSFNDRSRTYGC